MATTFPIFSEKRCPAEIQDLIWQHFIDQTGPRVLDMKLHKDLTGGPSALWDFSYHSPTSVPIALKVCSRSRHLAKRRWTLGLGTDGNQPKIWIDYAHDTLLFDNDPAYFIRVLGQDTQPSLIEFSVAISLIERMKLRHVQLQWASLFRVNYGRDGHNHEDLHQGQIQSNFLLRTFPALEVLTLHWRDGFWEYGIESSEPIRITFEEAGTRVAYVRFTVPGGYCGMDE